ncbi:MAG: PPC domain-containing protein [Phycisphaerae bacterium]|nr:PPC domain-containing protein [Phycisphaerae bacterium]
MRWKSKVCTLSAVLLCTAVVLSGAGPGHQAQLSNNPDLNLVPAPTAQEAKAILGSGAEAKDGGGKHDRQGGDTCAEAVDISGPLPISVSGTTVGYTNDYDEVCDYTGSTSPDVVYLFTPTETEILVFTLCDGMTDYDSKMYIYENVCPDAGNPYICNDDACTSAAGQDYVSQFITSVTAGNDYYIVVDGYGTSSGDYYLDIYEWVPLMPCPDNSVYEQPVHGPDDPWTAGVSDAGFPYLRYEDFSGLTSPICDVHWWGLEADASFVNCVQDPDTFEVKFYADDAGQPGAEVCSYTVTPTRVDTGYVYHTTYLLTLWEFSVDLDPCCDLADGWVSIQGVGDAACRFWWMDSPGGDRHHCGDDGTGIVCGGDNDYNPSLCLTAPAEGCCCIDDTTTLYWTTYEDCLAAGGRFAAGEVCDPDPFDPPCGSGKGACCHYDGTCTLEYPVDCAAAGEVFYEGMGCGDVDCVGACCLAGGVCVEVTEQDCLDQGGTFQGLAVTCTPNPCLGACCHVDGSCTMMEDDTSCLSPDLWLGLGTTCDECPCIVVCPGGATIETETCGDDPDTTNGGCNSSPNVFGTIACDETICGTGYANGTTRDTDWYEIVTTEPMIFTWTAEADFPIVIGYVPTDPIGSGDCATATSLDPYAVADDPCTEISVTTVCLVPGIHWFFVAARSYNDVSPCPANYVATLTCEPCTIPTGACCAQDGTCTPDTYEDDCLGTGGVWQGEGTGCDPNPCVPFYCEPCFSDLDDDWITNVTFNTINNDTVAEGAPCSYGDYTYLVTDAIRGSTYTLSVTFSSGTYTECVTAWFDWNNNYVFDATEMYLLTPCGASLTVTGDITVPVDAVVTQTTMRVMEKYSTASTDPCIVYSYGEAEDYGINIRLAPQFGACCVAEVCHDAVTQDDCENVLFGVYQGDGSDCDPNPCVGACCFLDGHCEVLTEDACAAAPGGDYQGGGTDCDPNPCPQPGDNCENPVQVTDAFTDSNTTQHGEDYEDTCLGYYDGDEDIIYEWTVTEDACFDVTLDPLGHPYTGFAIDDSCPPDMDCVAVSTNSGSAAHGVTGLNLTAGTYYIMVDSWVESPYYYPFDLTVALCPEGGACCHWPSGACTDEPDQVTCENQGPEYTYAGNGTSCATVTCPTPGDDCEGPIEVTDADLPFSDTNYTCGRGYDYGYHYTYCPACPETCLGSYDGGEDIIYEVTLASDTCLNIVMTTATTYTGMALDGSCPPDMDCIAYATNYSSGGVSLLGVNVTAGTYYLMIDTYPSPYCIPTFDLTIEVCPEGGACCHCPGPTCTDEPDQATCEGAGGVYMGDGTSCATTACAPCNDTCDTATPVTCGDTLLGETTVGANNDYDPVVAGCTGYKAEGPDVVYSLNLGSGQTVTVSMNPTPTSFDASLYVVTDCDDVDNTCVVGDDSGNPEVVTFTADAGVTYYIIADGYSTTSFGTFDLTVTCEAPPEGACCFNYAPYCQVMGADACHADPYFGTYMGDGTVCDTDDCNGNTIPDECEIALGLAEDCQPNGIPDDCDIDPTDPDGNGQVSADCQPDSIPDECQLGDVPGGVLIDESFEGTVPPAGWENIAYELNGPWQVSTNLDYVHTGLQSAIHTWSSDYDADSYLLTPELDITAGTLTVWSIGCVGESWCDYYDIDVMIVIGDPDGDTPDDDVFVGNLNDLWVDHFTTWIEASYDLAPLLPGGPFKIGFRYYGFDGDLGVIDDVVIETAGGPPSNDCNENGVPDECDLCGDLHPWPAGDGDVDGDDYQIFLAAFGHSAGEPEYNPCADYDGDGTVTGPDYQQWLMCYRDYKGDPNSGPPGPPPGESKDPKPHGDTPSGPSQMAPPLPAGGPQVTPWR